MRIPVVNGQFSLFDLIVLEEIKTDEEVLVTLVKKVLSQGLCLKKILPGYKRTYVEYLEQHHKLSPEKTLTLMFENGIKSSIFMEA